MGEVIPFPQAELLTPLGLYRGRNIAECYRRFQKDYDAFLSVGELSVGELIGYFDGYDGQELAADDSVNISVVIGRDLHPGGDDDCA